MREREEMSLVIIQESAHFVIVRPPGLSPKAMATMMGIAVKMVEVHTAEIMKNSASRPLPS